MIPRAHITAWRTQVPWPSDAQVEQDLIISRALDSEYNVKVTNHYGDEVLEVYECLNTAQGSL